MEATYAELNKELKNEINNNTTKRKNDYQYQNAYSNNNVASSTWRLSLYGRFEEQLQKQPLRSMEIQPSAALYCTDLSEIVNNQMFRM